MIDLCSSIGEMVTPRVFRMPTLHAGQMTVHRNPARFKVVICGRRWGKTRLGALECVADALKGGRAWWVAPTYKIAEEGWLVIRRIVRKIPDVKISMSERVVTMPSGGTVEVRSADNPAALVGAGLSLVVPDECADMSHEVWSESLRPALADRRGRAMFITTPRGHANWTFEDLWNRVDSDPVNWARFQMPTWTNPTIAKEEIEQMRSDMNPLRFKQEIGAEFVTLEGQVFPDFSREKHVMPCAYDPRLPVMLGIDFGYRTFAGVAMQRELSGTLRIFWDAEWHNIDTTGAAMRLRSMPWGSQVQTIGCDPAGDAINVQTGIDEAKVFRSAFPDANVMFSMAPNHRSPEWRASKIRDLLWSAAGEKRIVVDPVCKSVIRMFEASVYPKIRTGSGEKAEPVKDGVVDHIRDALGYLLVNVEHRQPAAFLKHRPI
jgi:hypothetical protein